MNSCKRARGGILRIVTIIPNASFLSSPTPSLNWHIHGTQIPEQAMQSITNDGSEDRPNLACHKSLDPGRGTPQYMHDNAVDWND